MPHETHRHDHAITPASLNGDCPEIRVEDLHRSFGTNRVLRGVDLVIGRSEIVAIVGASGCGKTVLLENLIGNIAPDRGRVLVADHESPHAPVVDLATLDEEGMDRIRRHWAIVFQRNALFSSSVYENIALWLREVGRVPERDIGPRVQHAVESVGLDPGAVLEMERDELSGGMAKRVAIARAVAMEPVLIFYDEPTTGLDPRHAAQIQELVCHTHRRIRNNGQRRTTVVITHDKDLLRRLQPRVIMLQGGRVHFDGPYHEFEDSESPHVRPYFDLMPILHERGATT